MIRFDNDRLLRNASFSFLNNINDILCGHVRKLVIHNYLLDTIFIRFGS